MSRALSASPQSDGPITLYYRPGTCALASYLALEESGGAYRAVDLSSDPDRLLRLNPRGKVPVLAVGDRLLRENIAILHFIGQTLPEAGLLPTDPLEQAECLSTAAWFASTLHIDYRRFLKPFAFSPDPAAHALISEQGRQSYVRGLAEVDANLKGRTWLHGERLSIADLYGLVFVEWALTSDLHDPAWLGIARWTDRLLQRRAVRQVLQATGSPLLRMRPIDSTLTGEH